MIHSTHIEIHSLDGVNYILPFNQMGIKARKVKLTKKSKAKFYYFVYVFNQNELESFEISETEYNFIYNELYLHLKN